MNLQPVHCIACSQPPAADGVSEDEGMPPSLAGDNEVPDDAFLMVTQLPWENQIIWDAPYTPGPPVSSVGEECDDVIW